MIRLFPFQIFIYSNENDKGLTREQSLLYNVSIKRCLVRLVTIHSIVCYYARTLNTSLGLNLKQAVITKGLEFEKIK